MKPSTTHYLILRRSAAIAVVTVFAGAVQAQRYQLRDGRSVDAEAVIVRDGQLVKKIEGGDGSQAEIAIPIGSIVGIDWPRPDGLVRAQAALATGVPLKALDEIEPVISQFAPFSKVPGSWWGEAELVRIQALLAAGKKADARKAAEKIVSSPPSPSLGSLGRIVLAGLDSEENRDSQAIAAVTDVRRQPMSADIEAESVVVLGDIELKRRNWDAALEAYLQLPAFHGTRDDLMPRALLGSARAYQGLNDMSRAERAALELVDGYPKSSQAAKAREEFPQ